MFRIKVLAGNGEELRQFSVDSDEHSLLAGAEHAGCRTIPVGCRGGGCGLCKLRVLSGAYRVKRMSRAHISEIEAANGYVLACRTYALTDLDVELIDSLPEEQADSQ